MKTNLFISFLLVLMVVLSFGCKKNDEDPPDDNNTDTTETLGFQVTIYDQAKACTGTTFFVYKYSDPDIIYEVDMQGNVVWKYELPVSMGSNQTEAELLSEDSILIVNQGVGLYIINRNGDILWQYNDPKVSHDADMLNNGHILYVYGMNDMKTDTTVKEITLDGTRVWGWKASEYFNYPPYSNIDPMASNGWAHTNSVSRLDNGNTIISMRNFDMIVIVNPLGVPVDTIKDIIKSPHDPCVIDSQYILAAHQTATVHSAVKYNRTTGQIEWQFDMTDQSDMPMRDVNLLPNGNILITGAKRLVEVIPSTNEVVWQLELTNTLSQGDGPSKGFYKAERITE